MAILKSGTPDKLTSFVPSEEKARSWYSRTAPPEYYKKSGTTTKGMDTSHLVLCISKSIKGS
jgi:hypothetical protein